MGYCMQNLEMMQDPEPCHIERETEAGWHGSLLQNLEVDPGAESMLPSQGGTVR